MSKRIPLFLAALSILALAGCSGQQAKAPATETATQASATAFKIGIMTGTVSQSEEEFRAASSSPRSTAAPHQARHLSRQLHEEQETVIAQLTGLAADPEVKVIIAAQAIPGSVAAARKIREQRPDILIGFFEPHEDPAIVNETADIAVQPDQLERGRTIIAEAAAMGAKNFVHYSFPRHMSQELLARRRDIMKQAAAAKGMQVPVRHRARSDGRGRAAGDAAVRARGPAPRGQEARHPRPRSSRPTAACRSRCIKSVLDNGGYVVRAVLPEPHARLPGAFGIAIPPDKAGDIDYINSENKRIIAEHKMSGHFGDGRLRQGARATGRRPAARRSAWPVLRSPGRRHRELDGRGAARAWEVDEVDDRHDAALCARSGCG